MNKVIEQRTYSKEEIAAIFKVPVQLLGNFRSVFASLAIAFGHGRMSLEEFHRQWRKCVRRVRYYRRTRHVGYRGRLVQVGSQLKRRRS